MIERYNTIKFPSEGLYTESASRFIAYAFPCSDEEFIKIKRAELRKQNPKAVHVVFAGRLGEDGNIERSSDDGEPSGSAGKPVLNELKSRALTNVIVFIVRYFGGKKLGVQGLINAYRSAASEAINNASTIVHEITEEYILEFNNLDSASLIHVIHKSGVKVISSEFGETCKFVISCRRSEKQIVLENLSQNRNIKIEFIRSH